MKIAVLGTGVVGQQIAGAMDRLGHHVTIGTRDVAATMARKETDGYGNPPVGVWLTDHPGVRLATFAEAATGAELVVNATSGTVSLIALQAAGPANLKGKVLVDIANELDFSKGMPPRSLARDDFSLAERIQAAHPEARVVKTLNTMNAYLMVDPASLGGGEHSVFVSGNDAGAKSIVKGLLADLGWKDIIDLGDITSARGPEMLMPVWLRLWGALQVPAFNYKIVR